MVQLIIGLLLAIGPYILGFIGLVLGIRLVWFLFSESGPNAFATIVLIIFAAVKGSAWLLILYLIPLLDCLRDMGVAMNSYNRNVKTDKFFRAKALTSLVTLGFSRIIFFLILQPKARRMGLAALNQEIEAGGQVRGWYYREHKFLGGEMSYYARQKIKELEKEGKLVSNEDIGNTEFQKSHEKLEALYPKKFFEKMVDKFAGDAEVKEMREKSRQKIIYYQGDGRLYLSSDTMQRLVGQICTAMSVKSSCPLAEIKYFPEVESLGLTDPLSDEERASEDHQRDEDIWLDLFIIKALKPLVESGDFEDNDFNDRDPLDNHAYRYTKSTKAMLSQSPETNPALALDDDDDD